MRTKALRHEGSSPSRPARGCCERRRRAAWRGRSMCGEVHDGGGGRERAVWRGWGDGHTRPSRTRVTACAMWGWAAVDPCTESENSEPLSVEAMVEAGRAVGARFSTPTRS